MILNAKNKDVILNFYRSKVYFFDSKNKQHLRDYYSCRFATFEERKKFLALNKEVAGINEVLDLTVRNKHKWDKKDNIKIEIQLTDNILSMFTRFADKYGYNYTAILDRLAVEALKDTDKSKERYLKQLKETNERSREKLKKILEILNT